MNPILKAERLEFRYKLNDEWVDALRAVDLEVNQGEFVCLAGPSGSGKTTLLSVLGLIENLQKGEVTLAGRKYSALNEPEKNQIRKNDVAFVFQNFNLFPVLTAYENVEYFLTHQEISAEERKARVEHALKTVGLTEHAQKSPNRMSGGQRQRVAIARALAKKPKVIFADEPTASLDSKTGEDIVNTLLKLTGEDGVTVIVSSHDQMVLAKSPRIVRLHDGRIHAV